MLLLLLLLLLFAGGGGGVLADVTLFILMAMKLNLGANWEPNSSYFFFITKQHFPSFTGNQRMQFAPKGTHSVSEEEVKLHPYNNSNHSTLDNMIAEYQLFHDRWIEGLKKLRDKELADPTANGRPSKGNDETVAV